MTEGNTGIAEKSDEHVNGKALSTENQGRSSAEEAAPKSALEKQLQALRDAYASRLPEKIARLEELCANISLHEVSILTAPAAEADNELLLEENCLQLAHRLCHNLAGSGATYGFPQLSRAARVLEQYLKSLISAETHFTDQTPQQITGYFVALNHAAKGSLVTLPNDVTPAEAIHKEKSRIAPPRADEALPDATPDAISPEAPLADLSFENSTVARQLQEQLAQPDTFWQDERKRLIFLATDDAVVARDLERQVAYFGYSVRTFSPRPSEAASPLSDLENAAVRTPPALLIVDAALKNSGIQDDSDAGPNESESTSNTEHASEETIVSRLQRLRERMGSEPLPLVFMAENGDMQARLRAVRAGGTAYFTKPLEVAELIDRLDAITTREIPEPYRILIVDDEPELAQLFSWTLQGAGMQTRVISDPLLIMEPLTDFRPDLILMDVYMPHYSGLELATAIRQQQDYVGIPIVFLSGGTNVDKQLSAMNSGADDFLTKPIRPDHLVAAVAARAQRSRAVRSFMIRDSLTGLLNHTTTKEQIEVEVSRARRNDEPLTFAMIDIDHFKSVNDNYGHLVGDRAVKNLSRLLQQRLRQTDIIGRYGGEEFAVLLAGADGTTAMQVMDKIRHSFAVLKHQAAGTEFSITFSAGIATFPACDSSARLVEAADKALYEAKRNGRNRIVTAHC